MKKLLARQTPAQVTGVGIQAKNKWMGLLVETLHSKETQ